MKVVLRHCSVATLKTTRTTRLILSLGKKRRTWTLRTMLMKTMMKHRPRQRKLASSHSEFHVYSVGHFNFVIVSQ